VLSLRRQCELLGLARGSWYYEPVGETAVNLKLMRRIDKLYVKRP
jgi:putative transposase